MPKSVEAGDYLPNTVIVKFKSKTGSGLINKSTLSLAPTGTIGRLAASVNTFKQKFPSNTSALFKISTATEPLALQNIYELTYTGSAQISTVINELLKNNDIEYAQPSYVAHVSYQPNDPFLQQSGLSYLNQIHAFEAWDIQPNSPNIIIGIVDSGSELDHPDLATNLYVNISDPINGLDDDGDGYIDNYYGWDFVGANANVMANDNDPGVKSALTTHGVHISGLASGVSNNGIGIASLAGNAKVLIVKTGSDNDGTTIYKGYEGIRYAADHGAQIINCSWGNSVAGQYEKDIVDYAINKGCLIVAATGNENTSAAQYPAAFPGVLAVTNVDPNDVRYKTSNYGYYASIAAPGTNILSTLYGKQYGELTGTSMSTPIVASAAALIKARFPQLSMLQVGEKLRVSADNIDLKNSAFAGQLGHGRLNVFKALKNASPSLRRQSYALKGSKTLSRGDTVSLYLSLRNYLEPASTVTVSLSTTSPYISMINPSVNAGNFETLETKGEVGPFIFTVGKDAPDNVSVLFQTRYQASGGYTDEEYFELPVALDYLNFSVNQITTTATSNGRIGYSDPNAQTGKGFVYKKQNLLYEADLMMGTSAMRFSDNAYSLNGNNNDFVRKQLIEQIPDPKLAFIGRAGFDDSGSPNALNIYVTHRHLAQSQSPDDKYTIVEYTLKNTGSEAHNNFYFGLYTDFDIDANGHDVTKFDESSKLAYTYAKTAGLPFAGVTLLTDQAAAYYPLSFDVAGNPLQRGFSKQDKFTTLSNGALSAGLGENSLSGFDVAFTVGYGPFNLPAGASKTLAFSFLGGDDLDDLKHSASSAQRLYSVLKPEESEKDKERLALLYNYPNPAAQQTTVVFDLSVTGQTTLELFDLQGRKVRTVVNKTMSSGSHLIDVDVSWLSAGTYIFRLISNQIASAHKLIVVR